MAAQIDGSWRSTTQSCAGRLCLVVVVSLLATRLVAAQPTTSRVSVGPAGIEANLNSWAGAISADGRFVVFSSVANNLVPDDTNGQSDVFVHNRQTGITTRVNVGTAGEQGNGSSDASGITADGRCVTFTSWASNLVAGDTNGVGDVFVHDRSTGVTTRVSVGAAGEQANDWSYGGAITADCRWVAFVSWASNLVPGGDTNNHSDVFVKDTETGAITRINVGPGGAQANGSSDYAAPGFSADGRLVVFSSAASNLVAGDTNGVGDVFVHDRQTGVTTRASVGAAGEQGNHNSQSGDISADGRWVAFDSFASNLVPHDTNGEVDVFVHDRQTGYTERVSVGPGGIQANARSDSPTITADGRWVVFESSASNLVADDTNNAQDVFVHDRRRGTTARVSVATGAIQAGSRSTYPAISPDGRWVTFTSWASNLVAGDTNALDDVFLRDRVDPACQVTVSPQPVSAPPAGRMDTVAVTATDGCAWTAVSQDPAWLTITDGAAGTGSGTMTYAVAANAGGRRTGAIAIWDQRFTVVQVEPDVPMAPEGLAVHAVQGQLVTLRWRIPPVGPLPTGFVLEGGVESGEVLASLPTAGLAPAFTFVAPPGSYYVRLHALNGAVRSLASNELRLHVQVPVPPSPPTTLLGLVNGSRVALSWTLTYEGGEPLGLVLDVTGPVTTALPLPVGETFSVADVPAGTYSVALRAVNGAGSSRATDPLTLAVPAPCTGPPEPPGQLQAYRVGRTVVVGWEPPTRGPAPTSYVLVVTGAWDGLLPTAARTLSGTVAPGAYTVSVAAWNWCGGSAATPPQTLVVP